MDELKLDLTEETLKEILEKIGVSCVFGEPVEKGDCTLIPVAEIKIGFGYGRGRGRCSPGMMKRMSKDTSGEEPGGDEAGEEGGEGTGGGYGGGGKAVPRGYIKITPDDVSYVPFVNPTRIALAGIAFSAFAVYTITKCVERCVCDSEE